MTPQQILIVAIRLLAVFWLLNVLGRIPVLIMNLQVLDPEGGFATALMMGVQFAVAVVLWIFPATFAGLLLRQGKMPVLTGNVPFSEWQALCLIAVGIFVLARALPDLAYWLILVPKLDQLAEPFTVEQKANFAATIVEMAVGVALILGATGLSSLIHRLRRAGVSANQ